MRQPRSPFGVSYLPRSPLWGSSIPPNPEHWNFGSSGVRCGEAAEFHYREKQGEKTYRGRLIAPVYKSKRLVRHILSTSYPYTAPQSRQTW
jgi:hypothetical protein